MFTKMPPLIKRAHDSVHFFMSEFSSRVVAESGLPADRYHLGKLILRGLKDDPDFVFQIDGANDESEFNGSALLRTIKCAISLKKLGLKKGDVMVLMAPNHLDLAIPLYAALYLGVIVAALDASLGMGELNDFFSIYQPKIVFCQSEKYSTVQNTLINAGVDAEVVTFDKGADCHSFKDFIQVYGDDYAVEDFKPADFDPDDTIAFLTATSGTTGLSKCVALSHKNLAITIPYLWLGFSNYPTPTKTVMVVSPLQWLSAVFHYLFSPILKFTRLQSSKPITQEVFCQLVNKYKPSYTAISPTLITSLIKFDSQNKCDLTCFETILLGGSAVPLNLIDDIKTMTPETRIASCYGLSEIGGPAFYEEFQERGSVGRPIGCLDYRLVDSQTMKDIYEPHVQGELWLKGPTVGKGYYKNPEATAEVFLNDGWLRSGDIFYRDEHWNFYFVERLKLLLKYKNHQISPLELETVIRKHTAVLDVAVVGLSDLECGELPVACVVSKPNHFVTAQEIKGIVKESLTDSKHLRGGVIFMNKLPMTISTKVHRRKLKEMVMVMARE